MPNSLSGPSCPNPPVSIAISGGTGSGKSHLARLLAPCLGGKTGIIALDHFYKDLGHLSLEERAKINFDHPGALDWPLIRSSIAECRSGKGCQIPNYEFASHTRTASTSELAPCDWYLFEGLWCWWDPTLLDLYDLKIFLDHPEDERLSRRKIRDVQTRGRTPESVESQWHQQAQPMHGLFVEPQRETADFILPGDATADEIRALSKSILKRVVAHPDLSTDISQPSP